MIANRSDEHNEPIGACSTFTVLLRRTLRSHLHRYEGHVGRAPAALFMTVRREMTDWRGKGARGATRMTYGFCPSPSRISRQSRQSRLSQGSEVAQEEFITHADCGGYLDTLQGFR